MGVFMKEQCGVFMQEYCFVIGQDIVRFFFF